MPPTRITRAELRLMRVLWDRGPLAIRDVRDALPARARPSYPTIQTLMYRLEAKGAVKRLSKRMGSAHVFAAVTPQSAVQAGLLEDVIAIFGGRRLPLVSHLIESGELSETELDQLRELLDRQRK